MDDGLFEVILIREPKNVIETQNIIAAILLQNFDSPYIEYFQTDKIAFEFNQPVPWTLDGEYGGDVLKAEISVENKAIGLLK